MSNFIASIKTNLNKRYPGIHHAIVKHYCTSILILIIFLAFILRYFQLHIGLPYLYFWDEPLTASNALQMMKTGDYNPHFFKYGSLMLYLNLLVDQLYRIYLSLTGAWEGVEAIRIEADTGWHWTISHPGFYFWNRFLTAIMGTATVFDHLLNQQIDMQQMDGHHIGLFFGRSPDPHYSFGLCNHGRASRPVCRPRRPVFHLVYRPRKTRLFHMEFNLRRVCHSGKIQFGPGNIASHRIADLSVLSGQNPAPKILLACDPHACQR